MTTTSSNGAMRRTRSASDDRTHFAWHETVESARSAMLEQSTFFGYSVAADGMSASDKTGIVIEVVPIAPRQSSETCGMAPPRHRDGAHAPQAWVLAMVANCARLADADSDDALRDSALMLLSLEVMRRSALQETPVYEEAMTAASGEMYDRWVQRYGWRRDRRYDLAVALVQLVAHDDTMRGQEAFWFAAVARLYGATPEQIQAAAQ